jgi:hypothetical protein
MDVLFQQLSKTSTERRKTMSRIMSDEKLEIIKLITTQHIRDLNAANGTNLQQDAVTIEDLLEFLGVHRPEAGGDGEDIPPDEQPEGWLCGGDTICGVNKVL